MEKKIQYLTADPYFSISISCQIILMGRSDSAETRPAAGPRKRKGEVWSVETFGMDACSTAGFQ